MGSTDETIDDMFEAQNLARTLSLQDLSKDKLNACKILSKLTCSSTTSSIGRSMSARRAGLSRRASPINLSRASVASDVDTLLSSDSSQKALRGWKRVKVCLKSAMRLCGHLNLRTKTRYDESSDSESMPSSKEKRKRESSRFMGL